MDRVPKEIFLKITRFLIAVALLRQASKTITSAEGESEVLALVTGLVLRYGKKLDGEILPGEVLVKRAGEYEILQAEPFLDSVVVDWVV